MQTNSDLSAGATFTDVCLEACYHAILILGAVKVVCRSLFSASDS